MNLTIQEGEVHPTYDPIPTRDLITSIAVQHGGPVLDVGTGACACMAVSLASAGLAVTAIDHASSAVRIAQEQAAGKLADRLDVRYLEAEHLPFPDAAFPVVVAFDALCHTRAPEMVITEMSRVCAADGLVIIAELNALGRELTRHLDGGFEQRLPDLLRPFCSSWQLLTTSFLDVYILSQRDRAPPHSFPDPTLATLPPKAGEP